MVSTLNKGYYLGIDGGATKTEAVICDEWGYVLGRGKAGGSNPHNLPIDVIIDNIFAAIHKAAEATYKKCKESIPEHMVFESACLGLAGLDTRADRDHVSLAINALPTKKKLFRSKKLILVNDGLIGLRSGTDKNFGICLVAGTGSNCYGLSPSGREALAGDWGFILGDQGSSFAIGKAILQQVMREHDGRSTPTKLIPIVLNYLHLEDVSQLVHWTYGRGVVPVEKIAQLAQIYDDIAMSDSLEMNEIINTGIRELVQAYEAVIHKMQFDPKHEFPVVLVGGLFSMKGQFADRIIRSILDRTPQASVFFPNRSSAEGATKIALMLNSKFDLFPQSALVFVNPSIK